MGDNRMTESILDRNRTHSGRIDTALWTAIIPAAGASTRMGGTAKVAMPVLGRPSIQRILDLVVPLCRKAIVVSSPSNFTEISSLVSEYGSGVEVAIQEHPTGTVDSVLAAERDVTTPNCLVIWADQMGASSASLKRVMESHEKNESSLTILTTRRRRPYVRISRDEEGRIDAFLQSREGEFEPNGFGESDCGLFAFQSQHLFRVLKAQRRSSIRRSGEAHLVTLLPAFEPSVTTLPSEHPTESLGMNTLRETALVERVLSLRGKNVNNL